MNVDQLNHDRVRESSIKELYKPSFTFLAYIRAFFGILLTFILFFLVLLILIPTVILSFGALKNVLIKYLGAFLGHSIMFIFGVKIKYDYSLYKPESPAVFISNHSSTIDMFAIIAMMLPKVRYVAKYEIQYNPIFFLVGHLTGQIFINRQNSAKAVEKLKKTYHKVKRDGLSLFIAPEGTRKHDSIVGVFKKGAFHTAKDLKYPIIPIYIDGAFTLCPGDHLLALPGEIVLRYYPPISTENWDDAKMNAEMARLESFYRDLYRETFKRQGLDLPV